MSLDVDLPIPGFEHAETFRTRPQSGHVLSLSPAGVVEEDPVVRTVMAWDGVRSIDAVTAVTDVPAPPAAAPGPPGSPGSSARAGRPTRPRRGRRPAPVRRPGDGLLGVGERIVKPGAPVLVTTQMDHDDARARRDAETGGVVRAIGLASFDPAWRDGRIGAWVRAHRPDLLS